jgi:hypothetical protein
MSYLKFWQGKRELELVLSSCRLPIKKIGHEKSGKGRGALASPHAQVTTHLLVP